MIEHDTHALIIGDREIAREGLKRLLREHGFDAECLSGEAVLGAMDTLAIAHPLPPEGDPHLVLVDMASRDAAMVLCGTLRSVYPRARIAVLGDVGDDVFTREVLAAGADGFIPRAGEVSLTVLMLALVVLGEKVVPTIFLDEVVRHSRPPPGAIAPAAVDSLSGRERHILHCLVGGDSNKIIARNLGIAEATVKVHVKTVLRKLNVTNRTQAAVWLLNSRSSSA